MEKRMSPCHYQDKQYCEVKLRVMCTERGTERLELFATRPHFSSHLPRYVVHSTHGAYSYNMVTAVPRHYVADSNANDGAEMTT